ncbi:hypothetical protein K440107A6_04310 [Lawsonibacter asaccharolyticus]
MQRVILHCDMNNFYASVECMLNPELKNKPVAVCGSVEERHGIVLAKNYAAKAFGVSTGEAIWQAKQKCQDLVIVEPHYEQYNSIIVFEDTRGHVQTKCKACGRETVFNVLEMRRLRRLQLYYSSLNG